MDVRFYLSVGLVMSLSVFMAALVTCISGDGQVTLKKTMHVTVLLMFASSSTRCGKQSRAEDAYDSIKHREFATILQA